MTKNKISFLLILLIVVAVLTGCEIICTDTDSRSESEKYYEKLLNCKKQIEEKTDFSPDVVIVLGSGLQDYADEIEVDTVIPFDSINGWPRATAPGHEGNLVFGRYNNLNVAVMQGRIHYYEGYSMNDVVLPIRVLHMMGADTCILTNSVGALNPEYRSGDFMCVADHIASFVPSPLIGENIDDMGERFVDMTEVYDKEMQETVIEAGKNNGITVHNGIYLQVTGPQYETPAEIKAYRSLGADTIAMSLAAEAIAARHMNMKVCGINCITSMAAGMEENGISHDSVTESAENSAENFKVLINSLLEYLEDISPEHDP